MREPGIFWWPGQLPAGIVNREISSTLDLLPTILDIADVEIPGDRVVDGYSLREMLLENLPGPRNTMFYYRGNDLRAVRHGPWKAHYITTSDRGREAVEQNPPVLFNLDKDPGEQHNVAETNPEILEEIYRIRMEHEKTFD